MAQSFPNCRKLGASSAMLTETYTRLMINHSRTGRYDEKLIARDNADWKLWRALDLALADGIPEPAI